jgi:hypothetical protein
MRTQFRALALTVLCAVLLLGACGGGDKSEEAEEKGLFGKMTEAAKGMKKAAKGLQETAKEMEEMEEMEPVPPVHFSKLIEYLPIEAYGLIRDEPTGETSQMGEWRFTSVTVKFKSEDRKQQIEVNIYDYAYISTMYLPYKMMWSMGFNKESTSGYERSIELDGYPAFESWKKKSLRETITVLVGKRFVVKTTARGMEEGQAKDLTTSIGLTALAEEKADEPAS